MRLIKEAGKKKGKEVKGKSIAVLLTLLAAFSGCGKAEGEMPQQKEEPLSLEEIGEISSALSPALQMLQQTPESFQKFVQVGKTNLDIEAAVHIPQLESLGQYLAEPEPVDAGKAVKALGGNPENAREPFERMEEEPFEPFFMAYGGFEYVINGTSFFQLEMTDLSACYVETQEYYQRSLLPADCEGAAAAALLAAKEAAAAMGLALIPGAVEEYASCAAQTAQRYDTRPPSSEGFYAVSLLHQLEGMPLRYATRSVSLFQEPVDGTLHRYAYRASPSLGLCFTVDSRGIRALQGTSYTFKRLREVESILSLEEAVEALVESPDLLRLATAGAAFSQSVQTVQVDEISLEYVYDKYYLTRLCTHGLQLNPMWCFSSQLDSGERGQLFVDAVSGRISWYFPEEPLDRLPHSQPFPGSAYYEGE